MRASCDAMTLRSAAISVSPFCTLDPVLLPESKITFKCSRDALNSGVVVRVGVLTEDGTRSDGVLPVRKGCAVARGVVNVRR